MLGIDFIRPGMGSQPGPASPLRAALKVVLWVGVSAAAVFATAFLAGWERLGSGAAALAGQPLLVDGLAIGYTLAFLLRAMAWKALLPPRVAIFPLFTALLSLPHLSDGGYWLRAGIAAVALVPMFLLFYRFDYPLKLRWTLWWALGIFAGGFIILTGWLVVTAVAAVLGLYLGFIVFLWGTVYYHLRIGTRWTNFTRFWRLVLENPDPTSGNFWSRSPRPCSWCWRFS